MTYIPFRELDLRFDPDCGPEQNENGVSFLDDRGFRVRISESELEEMMQVMEDGVEDKICITCGQVKVGV